MEEDEKIIKQEENLYFLIEKKNKKKIVYRNVEDRQEYDVFFKD